MKHVKFIHLSDLHFSVQIEKRKNYPILEQMGITQEEQLDALFSYMKMFHGDIDFMVITGDLIHDGTLEEYQNLKRLLKEHWDGLPIYTCPGNHDHRENYRKGFLSSAAGNIDIGCFSSIDPATGIEFISLDSCTDRSVVGSMPNDQLDYLRDKLQHKSEKGRILILHNPPVIASKFTFNAVDLEKFRNIIAGKDIIALLSGHIHSIRSFVFAGIPSYSIGSAGFGIYIHEGQKYYTNQLSFNYCTLDHNGFNAAAIPFRLGDLITIAVD